MMTDGSVISNVKLAVDAFRHVNDRFDDLQSIMARCHVQAQDFMVDVGFVDGHEERTQGVYLYCRKPLDGMAVAELVSLFHPYLFDILPIPDMDNDGDVVMDDSKVIDLPDELMVS
jgi:hypothetical protein